MIATWTKAALQACDRWVRCPECHGIGATPLAGGDWDRCQVCGGAGGRAMRCCASRRFRTTRHPITFTLI
jgi:DnaJ-class molecular chaperone